MNVHGQPLTSGNTELQPVQAKGKTLLDHSNHEENLTYLFHEGIFFCERISYWLKEATDETLKKNQHELSPQMKLDAQ